MASLNLLSATDLAASYDIKNKKLKLSAEILIDSVTWGISFIQQASSSSLLFDLKGWTAWPEKHRKEHFEETFTIERLRRVFIADAEHPHGVPVDVLIISGTIDLGEEGKASTPTTTLTNLNDLYPTQPIKINAAYRVAFPISQSVALPKFGEILPKFDPSFLILEDATIIDGDIVWTFLPIQIGQTQVIVSILGGIAQYHKTITYDINVILPLEPGPVILSPPKDSATQGSGDDGDRLPITFLERVDVARNIVVAKWPEAKLCHVTASNQSIDGVEKIAQLNHMNVIFKNEVAPKGTIIINSPTPTSWDHPTFIPHVIFPMVDLPWPVPFPAEEANELRIKEKHTGRFKSVTLLKRIHPIPDIWYEFEMVKGPPVWITLFKKEVTLGGPTPQAA
jgi:hypothetical protein